MDILLYRSILHEEFAWTNPHCSLGIYIILVFKISKHAHGIVFLHTVYSSTRR